MQAQTPSTCRIVDLLGPTNMGELSMIFGELVRVLKDLPPGGFDKAYAHKPPNSAASKAVSFMCDKQSFKEAVRLAEMGASLAERAHLPDTSPPDPFVETILAGMRSLEVKVDQLSLDTANLAAKQEPPPKTFAAAVSSSAPSEPHRGKPRPGAKGKKPPSAPAPTQAPKLTLAQLATDKADFVEMSTDPSDLANQAMTAINSALKEHATVTGAPVNPVSVRGITRNNFTGEIHFHLNSQEGLKEVSALKTDAWIVSVNRDLCLKRRIYPIIVHGIPTTFNPESRVQLHNFIEENQGVLDSTTKVVWANKHSIATGKPFSSLIIHLFDPMAANQAITNRIVFKHLLKVAEKSTKRIKQCYTCLDYGHYAKTCSEDLRACSHCAGQHHYDACTKRAAPIRCVNCVHHILDTDFPDNPSATVKNLSDAQTILCTHSAFSNSCPLRKLQVEKNASMSDLYKVPSHD